MTGPDLRNKRQALHITTAELSRRWGVHPESLRNWERGRYPVPLWVDDALRWLAHERVTALTRMQEE